MGLFEKIFKKSEQTKVLNGYWKTLTAYTPMFSSWNGNLYESELVRSAIDARARHISKLSVEVLGNAKPKLKTIISKKPNDFQTWAQFLYRLSTILDMQNTAFIVPVFDGMNNITGYYPVLPQSCEIVTNNGNPWLRYTFSSGGRAAVELSLCGVMTKFQYHDDIFGDKNSALNDTMKLIDIQKQGVKEAIKNSAAYRFMAQVNNFADAEDLAEERKRFSKENLSRDAGGGLLLFPNTYANIQQIKANPYTVDAEQLKLIQTNVFNYFGVNEDILQNRAFGDAWSAFYEGCVEVFAVQFSEVMTKMTFTQTEQSYGAQIIATSNRLQYLSNKDKLEVSSQMADRGIMSINEIRQIWNLPPVADGDTRTIRGEYYSVDEKTEGGTDGKDYSEN